MPLIGIRSHVGGAVIVFRAFERQLDRSGLTCGKLELAELVELAWTALAKGRYPASAMLLARLAVDAEAAGFYRHYGFRYLGDEGLRLFMTTKDLVATFAHGGS